MTLSHTKILKPVMILAFAVFALAGVQEARAQEHPTAVIAIFDSDRLMRESLAGQDIERQYEQMLTDFQEDFEARRQEFEEERKAFEKEIVLIEDEKEAQQKAVDLKTKADEHNRRLEERRRQIALAYREANSDLMRELNPIFQRIMDRHGATVLLERNQVLIANDKLDITGEVIEALNQKITSVELELPEG